MLDSRAWGVSWAFQKFFTSLIQNKLQFLGKIKTSKMFHVAQSATVQRTGREKVHNLTICAMIVMDTNPCTVAFLYLKDNCRFWFWSSFWGLYHCTSLIVKKIHCKMKRYAYSFITWGAAYVTSYSVNISCLRALVEALLGTLAHSRLKRKEKTQLNTVSPFTFKVQSPISIFCLENVLSPQSSASAIRFHHRDMNTSL